MTIFQNSNGNLVTIDEDSPAHAIYAESDAWEEAGQASDPLVALKAEATELGVEFSPNIGEAKLTERVEAARSAASEDADAAPADSPS